VDYRNSLFLNLAANQLDCLQLVLNSAARAVTNTPKFHHITLIPKSLHWLKICEQVHYKILSITYKCLLSDKPAYLQNLLTVQSTSTTRSTFVITLKCPYNPSSFKISNRSYYHSNPALWNIQINTPIQLHSLQKLDHCVFNYHLNFTRTLKFIFCSFLSYLTLSPTRAASVVFDPGFVLVIRSHFHLSFALNSFAVFYFMDKLGSVLLSKQEFFYV
jgi:hypothetical protein